MFFVLFFGNRRAGEAEEPEEKDKGKGREGGREEKEIEGETKEGNKRRKEERQGKEEAKGTKRGRRNKLSIQTKATRHFQALAQSKSDKCLED